MKGISRRLVGSMLAGLALLAVGHPQAAFAQQDWPTKPVTVIIPFSPGGSTDVIGRLLTQELSKRLGQNFVMEYKPGGGGVVAAQEVARSPSDGYTMQLSGVASNVIAPIRAKTKLDAIEDFTNIAVIGGGPVVLVAHPSTEATSIKDFVDLSKAAPDGFSVAHSGIGSTVHLFLELFKKETEAGLVPVAYAGSGPAIAEVVANQVPYGFITLISVSEFVKSGQMKLLGVSSETRSPQFPDASTFKEAGYPSLVGTSWFSISAPAGVPTEIAEKMNKTMNEILADPAVRNTLLAESVEIAPPLDLAGVKAYYQAELDRWRPLIEATNN